MSQCCPSTLPPVTANDYTPKGSFEEINGLKTYITGSTSAARGIIDLYDAFGPASQILQGADRLAASLNALVLIPDLLEGSYAKEEWFTSKDPKVQAAYAKFGAVAMDFPKQVPALLSVTAAAKEKYPGVRAWGAFGLCWGAKVVALASGKDTPFKVTGQGHPAKPTKEDAEAMTIPHICLAAPTDNKEGGVDGYAEVFSKKGDNYHVETYETMFHGWMGARANLKDEANSKEYEKGYNQIATFFAKHF